VDAFGGPLRRAGQHDRAEIHARIGLQMIYRPGTETVLAEVRSNDIDRVPVMCPEPELNPYHMVKLRKDLAVLNLPTVTEAGVTGFEPATDLVLETSALSVEQDHLQQQNGNRAHNSALS
jgi:hypothetical protein